MIAEFFYDSYVSLSIAESLRTSVNAWPRKVPIPKQYLCPLTKLLMEHPVIDREGNSYEKDAM